MPTPSVSSSTGEGTRRSPGPNIVLRLIGWMATVVLMAIIAMAGLGFFWLHKAKETGLNPYLIKKNRDLAAAELAVIRNGNVRVVSTNDAAETMLVRDNKTGKTIALKFDRATKSMVEIEEHGKQPAPAAARSSGTAETKQPDATATPAATSGTLPSWVPVYPGASLQNQLSAADNQKQAGSYTFVSPDPPDKVLSYYSQQLTSEGMKLMTTGSSLNTGFIVGIQESEGRTVWVSAATASDGTHVSVKYEQKKQAATATP
ncbi:MAG: hypothetical protein ACM3SW_07370 [Actinomycetota bacterium]